jgi:hypothetical protein
MIGMQGSNNMLLFWVCSNFLWWLRANMQDLQRKPNDLFSLHQLIMIREGKPEK